MRDFQKQLAFSQGIPRENLHPDMWRLISTSQDQPMDRPDYKYSDIKDWWLHLWGEGAILFIVETNMSSFLLSEYTLITSVRRFDHRVVIESEKWPRVGSKGVRMI